MERLWIRISIDFGQLEMRIRIQKCKDDPQTEKSEKISCFKVLDVLF
jgi:hypothetical protein